MAAYVLLGWEFSMKRILIAAALALAAGGQALAADLPQPAPVPRAPATYIPAPVPYYNWTGFYIGGNLGTDWNQGNYCDNLGNCIGATNTFKFLGGGQVGFNYEFNGGVVIGAEADFDWAPNNNNSVVGPVGYGFTANNGWLTTFTGRLGYAWDRFLVYGKGGGAWVGTGNSAVVNAAGVQVASLNTSNYGWTAGAGIEYAFWGTVSVRLEYDYVGLSSQSFTIPATAAVLPGDVFSTSNNRSIQMVNVGLNYKFGY